MSSSSPNLHNFLKALEDVKNDYTCGVCSQFCKNPVTLSTCFHLICSEHFDELKFCPVCNTSLQSCTKFYDPELPTCIDSAKELYNFFRTYNFSQKPEVSNNVESSLSQIPNTCVVRTEQKSKNGEDTETSKKINTDTTTSKLKSNVLPSTTNVTSSKKALTSKRTGTTSPHSSKSRKRTKVVKTNSNQSIPNEVNTKHESNSILNTKDSVKMLVADQASEQYKRSISNTSMLNNKINKTIEKCNSKGETLLHTACRLGKVDRIIELLEQGANTNTKDNAGWTPLHEVVQNGCLDLVRILLQYNTLIDVPGQHNETPLHEAVRYNHSDIAEELVKYGADIHARNCKGETPYQLASADMQKTLITALENIVQTQGLNITHMSLFHAELDFDDIHVYCISKFGTVHNKLNALAKAHSNMTITSKMMKKVSHLIVDAKDGICRSSVEVLQGIVSSVWILSSEWVTKSSDKCLEPFTRYEIIGVGNKTYNGPKNSRYNKYKQLPGIFNGCFFYLHDFNSKYEVSKELILTKASLSKLITKADGVILRRVPNPELIPDEEKLVPYHAKKDGKLVNCSHYIIFKEMYQPMYNMQHLKALPVGWLIECLEKYELCDPW